MAIATTNSCPTNRSARAIEIVSDSLAYGMVFAIGLTIIQRGVGFVRGVLFCRILTDQELGQWSMAYSFLMLLAPLAVLGLPGSFGRYVEHYLQRSQLGTFVRRIAVVSSLLTLGLATLMFLAPGFFAELIFRTPSRTGVINAMAFALIFVTANNFLSSLMESLRQVRLATIMRFTTGVTFAVTGTVFIAVWQDGASAAAIGFGLACLAGLMPGIAFLWTHRLTLSSASSEVSHTGMWKRIAPFAIWLWASNLVTNMFEVTDRYMLIHWSNVSPDQAHGFVGQYHSGRVLPLLLVGVGVVIEGMLLPFMTALWESNRKSEATRQISTTLKSVAIGFTTGGVVIMLLAPLLFDVVLSGRYDGGRAVLPMTMVYCIWISLNTMGQTWLWVAEKGKFVFLLTGCGLILNLILNAILIPHFGLWGAVFATSAATLFCLLMTMFVNSINGFRSSAGVLAAGAMPLLILLPPSIAPLAVIALLAIAMTTPWIFSAEEKTFVIDGFNKLKLRFLGR